jgi:hypothetical protein
MSDLATLRDNVELDLDDSSNEVFSTGDVDRGIAKALNDYSAVNPEKAVGTITLSADGREISISSLSGLIRVTKVWFPYDSADADHPPNWVEWSLWGSTLYIGSGDEPQSGEVVRVFYHKLHTINGLDGETATTVPTEDLEVVCTGAAAYCCLQKSRGAVGEAGVSTETPEHWMNIALQLLDDFNEALRRVRQRELLRIDKRVPLEEEGWQVDDYDGGI